MSFYRKYRPQKLSEIVGQNHVRQTFLNALKNSALTHAYLFAGSRGTGKTSVARIIARALNCLSPAADGEPCNSCQICRAALDGKLVDLIEIDAASNRGIDEIRDLKEKIQFTPSHAKNKIYIIDEVHMLTKEAFNALLKTLEEPPSHAYFILATTEAHKIPETIISRTQRFDFHRIAEDEISAHLATISEKERIKFDPAALGLIAKQSAGGMRDALGMLEQLGSSGEISVENVAQNLGLTRPKAVEDFVSALLSHQLTEAFEIINGLVGEGANLIQFNKTILIKLREVMLQKVSENKLNEAKGVLTIIEEFTRANEELKNAVIPQLPLEAAVVIVCVGSQNQDSSTKNIPQNLPKKAVPPKKDELEKKLDAVATEASAQKISSAGEISIPMVEAVLPQVLGKIQNPTVKMALKSAKILKVASNEIELGVGSDFLVEKLDLSARNLLAEKFSEILGKQFQIKVSRAEIEIQSAAPEIPKIPKKKTVAEAAEGMFDEGW
ncbi:DNA polymerase III subunit gamma/tau [Candidatus Gracilibacteria bacterium]|nr:DNA polymerase III subunit gamma/tau [Candidatus Gracilibacteria bacterium]MCF7856442.1 DNA polymerase III subunit gamma/tau [Candidatus Gracilibacteria bacterium]MCF7896563.1 DNA polymerase III subunit gamma/tau [Candidatus Gracilibacteria bacterium]